MYDIAMSSKASCGDSQIQDASYIGPVADVEYLTEINDLDFHDEPMTGSGSFLLKGGILCLVATVMLTGYQFIPVGKTQQGNQEVASLHDWDKKTDNAGEGSDFLVAVERRFAEAKTLDMKATASTAVSDLINKSQEKITVPKKQGSKASKSQAHEGKQYIVQAGDTLSKIARMFKTSSKTIIAMNEIENPSLIRPGMRLIITK